MYDFPTTIDFDNRKWRLAIAFTADQEPQPRGSKKSVRVKDPRNPFAKAKLRVLDDNPQSGVWMQYVRAKAKEAWRGGAVISGPCVLSIRFRFLRPRSHLSIRKGATRADVKPSYPADMVYKPDLTKLIRGVEDAMTGVVWKDDCQVIGYHAMTKHWSSEWHGADVAVYELALGEAGG